MDDVVFVGLEPWIPAENYPIIECVTADGVVDLHNSFDFVGVTLKPVNECLIFAFRPTEFWRGGDAKDELFALSFEGVRSLSVEQSTDFDPRAGGSLEEIYFFVRTGVPTFRVNAGDFEFEFEGRQVGFSRFTNGWEALG